MLSDAVQVYAPHPYPPTPPSPTSDCETLKAGTMPLPFCVYSQHLAQDPAQSVPTQHWLKDSVKR